MKGKVIFLVSIFVSLAILMSNSVNAEQTNQDKENTYKVTITVEFSETEIMFDKLNGYDILRMKDADYFAELGKPMLPTKCLRRAMPSGIAVTGVKVIDTQSVEIPGEYMVFPAQPPRRYVKAKDNIDFTEPDSQVYKSSQPYPTDLATFIDQGDIAGQSIATIQLFPLQYIPLEKKLILYTSMTVAISGVDGYVCGDYLPRSITENGIATYEKMIKDMVINPEDVVLNTDVTGAPVVTDLPPGGPYDHVIITSTSYESYYDDLVEWHTKRGLRDVVVTTSYIYSNYSGTDNQQKIRNFIIDAHNNWGTQYFLLAGENGTVPFKYMTYYEESTPSDQYYSDYDSDWYHEVFVGRVTADNSSQINLFIDKVIHYEKNPPISGYPLDILLIGMDVDSYTHCEYLKETIDGYIPSRFNVTKVYDSYGGYHTADVINALNAGQNLVNHADHGEWNVMGTGDYNHGWGIDNSDVDGLYNNGQLSIVVSLACLVNKVDHYSDCISEHFVVYNSNQAGVAFNGNTRNGIYYVGYPEELSGKLDKEWWNGLFNRSKFILGQTIIDSKHHFSTGSPDVNIKRHCEWTFNLLGEPSMPIWTDTPESLVVSHPDNLPPAPSSFTVHVEEVGGDDVYSAYVCLWKGDEVYLTGYTNSSGDITFNPSPTTPGIMYVTVTKHNFLPYESEATVLEYLGSISGEVTNAETSNPVNGVYVEALNTSSNDYTDINGEYLLSGLEAGSYDVFLSHPEYYDTTIYGIIVNTNENTTLDVALQPLPGADVGVSAILSPPDSIQMGESYPLEVEISNYGTNPQSFNVIFEIRASGSPSIELTDTTTVNNMPATSVDTVTFSENFVPEFGTDYDLISYTTLSGDQNNSNDTSYAISYSYGGVFIWYGNTSDVPIFGFVNQRVGVNVYVQTSGNTYIADMHLCLGTDDQYIDSLLSDVEGELYYPLTEWDDASFMEPQGSPPNSTGWSSQSFLGWADLGGAPNPWLHSETPIRVMRFIVKTVDDPLLIGDTVQCFGPGINTPLGTSYATDTLGRINYPLFEQFSLMLFAEANYCDYVPGDINSDGSVMGNDVTYGVRYFKGLGPNPPDSCWNETNGSWLYSGGDVNGDCEFRGSDITFLVSYFKGYQTSILWCPWTPPVGIVSLGKNGDINPVIHNENSGNDIKR